MNNLNRPNCFSTMETTIKYRIEIDYCPTCKGIWLDRGEIDKIDGLEKKYNETDNQRRNYKNDDSDEGDGFSGGKNNRRGGFLGELFGFD